MNRELPSSVSRLAGANPSPVDNDRGRSPHAQAILSQILAGERSVAPRAPRAAPDPPAPHRPSRRLVLVMAVVLLLAAGAAVAVTDPFGFWRSSSPGTAMFAVDPGRHVRTPTARAIACPSTSAGYFRCGPQLQGRRYQFIDQIDDLQCHATARSACSRRAE